MNRTRNMYDFESFKDSAALSMEEICSEIFREYQHRIRIKKEKVAVKNLVKIFNATLSLSARKGFHAMSLRDLSKECGLSMGALYAYFTNKEMLLEIILLQGRRLIKKTLEEVIFNEKFAWHKLVALLRTHIFLSEVLHKWFFFSFMEAKNLSKEEQKAAIASELYTEKLIADILFEGKDKGLFAVEDPIMTASLIKAMLQDWYLKRWKYKKRGISVEEYSDFVTKAIAKIIGVHLQ
ncbi:MAG: TetR/AcrR family transcriptional regulator [Spirochaetes bacterium]|nr:TetR/AcrR family transcriptional regulator [Spirochaetota bacterium]